MFPPRPAKFLSFAGRLVGLCLIFLGVGLQAQTLKSPNIVTARSYSGQFVVKGPQTAPTLPIKVQGDKDSDDGLIGLEAGALAVTCEQVKHALLKQLDREDHWKDKVYVEIAPDAEDDSDILMATVKYRDGWRYQLRLPVRIDPDKLLLAIVRTSLLELANRNSKGHSADLPLWLTEGMTKHLIATSPTPLVMQPKKLKDILPKVAPSRLIEDPLLEPRAHLQKYNAWTFQEMSLPSDVQMNPLEWTHFRHCAHVLVQSLLRTPNGPKNLGAMLDAMPNYLNWQFALLEGFQGQFASPLDIEKWWSLTLVDLKSFDSHNRWTYQPAVRRLDQILDTSVTLDPGVDAVPTQRNLELQLLIDLVEWDQQRPYIMDVISQLIFFQIHAPEDLVKLAGDYRITLMEYVNSRDTAAKTTRRGEVATSHKVIVRETLDKLKLLDVLRSDFRAYQEDRLDDITKSAPAEPPAELVGTPE